MPKFSVPDHPIGRTWGIGTSEFFFGTKNFLHSANLQATVWTAWFLWVLPKSSFKKLLLGTGLWQHAKMSTSLKSPDGLKDAQCEKRAAVPPAAHSVCTCGSHRHAQGRNSTFQGQASRRVTPQYAHLLPWEQQGIPCAHCCGPPYHWTEGAAQEVQDACQDCCETVRGIEESPRSHGFLRNRLHERGC